jgi:hypothetical protein
MDKAAWKWNDGSKPFDVLIRNRFPYCLAYKFEGTDGFSNRGIRVVDYDYEGNCVFHPATDFIGSEGEMERGITITKQNGEVISAETELQYWKTRCELAEKFIDKSPCDPDIYEDQLKAWNEYQEFIKPRNTPTNEQR